MTKWGDRPHWEFEATYLGSDIHGDWIGTPAGTPHQRPGASYVSEVAAVTLVPEAAYHLSTFHAPGIWCGVYVDIATPVRWDGSVIRSVDLDLDVIRGDTGRVWIDDEDEFARHRVQLGYPAEVVRAATTSCDRLFADVEARRAPYDETADAWLAHLGRLLGP